MATLPSHGPALGLSARAEVVRPPGRSPARPRRSLRASGGGPDTTDEHADPHPVSPRERRWSVRSLHQGGKGEGLSARAEVVRPALQGTVPPSRSLRASGGGPMWRGTSKASQMVSPRERRWSARHRLRRRRGQGLSARAEVVRPSPTPPPTRSRSLRASGGGPPHMAAEQAEPTVSPRERRWSSERPSGAVSGTVSPRERRWSAADRGGPADSGGLSARAEVVRSRSSAARSGSRSLRASGGGPRPLTLFPHGVVVSPRERRWSGGAGGATT